MASAVEQQQAKIAAITKQAEANQSEISRLEKLDPTQMGKEHQSTLEALYAKQRDFNTQRGNLSTSLEQNERVGVSLDMAFERAESLIPKEALGRIPAPGDELSSLRSKILQERESRFDEAQKAEAQGLSTFEKNLIESRGLQTIQRTEEANRRRLQAIQSRLGVRGGTAASQQMAILSQGSRERSELAQNISMQDIGLRREDETRIRNERTQSLADLQTTVESRIADDRSRELQNIKLEAAERAARFSYAFGLVGLSEQAQGVDKSLESARLAAQTGSGGGKK